MYLTAIMTSPTAYFVSLLPLAIALTETGKLYTWGGGMHGKLGHGAEIGRAAPCVVEGSVRGKGYYYCHSVSCFQQRLTHRTASAASSFETLYVCLNLV